jgi:hypothetical protein
MPWPANLQAAVSRVILIRVDSVRYLHLTLRLFDDRIRRWCSACLGMAGRVAIVTVAARVSALPPKNADVFTWEPV